MKKTFSLLLLATSLQYSTITADLNKAPVSCTLVHDFGGEKLTFEALMDGHIMVYNANNVLLQERLTAPNSIICSLQPDKETDNKIFYSTLDSCAGSINLNIEDGKPNIESSVMALNGDDIVDYATCDDNTEDKKLLTICDTPIAHLLLVRARSLTNKDNMQYGVVNKEINLQDKFKKAVAITLLKDNVLEFAYDNKTIEKVTLENFKKPIVKIPFKDLSIEILDDHSIELYRQTILIDTIKETQLRLPIVEFIHKSPESCAVIKKYANEFNESFNVLSLQTLDRSVYRILITTKGAEEPFIEKSTLTKRKN